MASLTLLKSNIFLSCVWYHVYFTDDCGGGGKGGGGCGVEHSLRWEGFFKEDFLEAEAKRQLLFY